MAIVKYVGPLSGVKVDPFHFPKGEPVEVPEGIAEELIAKASFEHTDESPLKEEDSNGEGTLDVVTNLQEEE